MKAILKRLGLLLLTSILLYASWPPSVFGPIIFIALTPLLYYVDSIGTSSKGKRYFITLIGILASLFIFGLLAASNGWGDYNDQAYMAILMCFLPLSVVISFYSSFRIKKIGFLFLVFGWGALEILQMNWEMNSPLLMIGNALSLYPSTIQHYAVWGVTGGTMHIVAINIVLFLILKKSLAKHSIKKELIVLSTLLIPILISIVVFQIPSKEDRKVKIGMALAHFEHFTMENAMDPMLTINRYNHIISQYDISDVEVMFFPESAVVNGGWIENLSNKNLSNPLDSLCPEKEIFLGAHMFSLYNGKSNDVPYDVCYDASSKIDYRNHNCVIFRNTTGRYSVRSKDKFIPSHEIVPYPSIFMFTSDWFNKSENPFYLSSYHGSVQRPFKLSKGIKIYSLMCFESTFSNMIVKQNDADLIVILANESWNFQTKGKEQYFNYMSPKAIESGKGILKVANSGYSGYINSKGQVISKIDFDKAQVVKLDVEIDGECSFYSRFHDKIVVFIIFITSILVIYLIFMNKGWKSKIQG